nr:unnamed protein product [Spirometra erinaceieuropaei]
MFSAMLMDAYRDERPGIRIAYRTDAQLLNQRRMHFQSRISTTTVHELLFADDFALNTTSEGETQWSMDLFSAAREKVGLVINTQKTVVMHQKMKMRSLGQENYLPDVSDSYSNPSSETFADRGEGIGQDRLQSKSQKLVGGSSVLCPMRIKPHENADTRD